MLEVQQKMTDMERKDAPTKCTGIAHLLTLLNFLLTLLRHQNFTLHIISLKLSQCVR